MRIARIASIGLASLSGDDGGSRRSRLRAAILVIGLGWRGSDGSALGARWGVHALSGVGRVGDVILGIGLCGNGSGLIGL